MIKNYLKISFRYLQRHKEHSIINIFGLAVSVTCCILIMMFVRSELSYDTFHSKADRLYRVWQREKINDKTFDNVVTPLPAAGAIKSSFPEVEYSCRVLNFKPVIKIDRSTFTEDVDLVDPSFFKLFDFGLIKGDADHAFPTDNSVVLTAAAAKKYFGTGDAIGKNIEVQMGYDKILFTVSGVVNDVPEASSIQYQMLMPFANASHLFRPQMFSNWFNVFSETYVLLKPGANAPALEKKFPAMMKQQLGADFGKEDFTVHLQNIKDIHLDTSLPAGNEPISDPKYAYILGTIGVLILAIACINFITLSISRSTKRALEVGVRKALGAEKGQLVFQFWGEAFLLVLCSVIIGIFLAAALLKPFDALVSKQLSFHADLFFIVFCLLLVGFIAVISGVYPALILSGFKPVEVLKGKINVKAGNGWLHKGLVVGQFTTSVVMIIGTLIIGQQMKYLQTKDLGYKKDQVVVVSTNKSLKEGIPLANLYRNELVKHAQVLNASVSVYSFAETPWVQLGYADEKKQYGTIQYNAIDANFIPEMGIKLINGRNFVAGNTNDIAGTAIVNEAYVKAFNLTDPVGKKLPGPFPQEIIGVVKDFNFESLHTKIQPLVMSVDPLAVIKRASDVNLSGLRSPASRFY